jgi:hypothetical protein
MFRVMASFMPPPALGSGTSSIGGRLRLGPSGVCPQELLGEEFELDIEERDSVLDADSGQQVWQLFSTRSGSVISPRDGRLGMLVSDPAAVWFA